MNNFVEATLTVKTGSSIEPSVNLKQKVEDVTTISFGQILNL